MPNFKYIRGVFFVVVLVLYCTQKVQSQQPFPINSLSQFQNLNDSIDHFTGLPKEREEMTDTTEQEKKVRKPLESFYFKDSMHQKSIFSWVVNSDFHTVDMHVVDTLMDLFQMDYSFQREGVGYATLGNVGSALIPLNYFRRSRPNNFSFLESWMPYIKRSEQVQFYNSKTPYVLLSYQMSGQSNEEEQLFNVVFAHNVSPSTSFNIEYNADGTRGEYINQLTLDRYFTANISHTGKNYAIHSGYIYNKGIMNENGGVVNTGEITDTIISSSNQIDVKLREAQNRYTGNTFWMSQSYGIPLRQIAEDEVSIDNIPTIYVGQSLNYTTFNKHYTSQDDNILYPISFIDTVNTYDSISESLLDVKFFTQLQPYNRNGVIGLISAGIGTEFSKYYNEVPPSYQQDYGAGGTRNTNSTYLYGDVRGQISKYMLWDASAKYYMFGYRSQDIALSGNINLKAYIKEQPIILTAKASYQLTTPDLWVQSYFSNHYAWSNSFVKPSTLRLNAEFNVSHWNLLLGADYEVTQNKIYFDKDVVVSQYEDNLSILGFYLRKNFHIGGFNLNHMVLAQFSSNQSVAPVPLVSTFLSYYYEFDVVKDILRLQLGLDGRYNTKYYAFGYDPALGQFYNQRQTELGNYPYLDFFINAKWKRMRILLKLQHWNANLFGEQNYFQVLDHPQNRMMFKIGISWSFYD